MENKKLACAITMVGDDFFFLERWVRYYSEFFGRDALYVISHGGNPRVAEIAEGCNVIALPGVFNERFDATRWRLLNGLGNGLRGYYEFVLIGDVDEFVVVDPKMGLGLDDFLGKRRNKQTITPVGLEVVHKPELEGAPVDDAILGPRRFVRFTTAYSKPCIYNRPTDLSRGGHFAKDPELKLFRNLYLFHMRYADESIYRDTIMRRGQQIDEMSDGGEEKLISWNWRPQDGKPDPYQRAAEMPMVDGFDLSAEVDRMRSTWAPREHGLYAFEREIGQTLHTLPDRFYGVV